MSNQLKSIKAFFNAGWQKKINILEIIFLVIKFTLIVRYIPLRYYYNKYFSYQQYHSVDLKHYHKDIYLIRSVIKHVPWQITCLMESLIVKRYLLIKYRIIIPISIGIKMADELLAHAWYGINLDHSFLIINRSCEIHNLDPS